MTSAVRDEREGMDDLLAALAFMDDNVVDSGILANPDGDRGGFNADVIMIDDDRKQNEDRLTVGNIAGFHEFGMGVPERSFVRATFDNETLAIENQITDEVRMVFDGRRTAPVAMANMGKFAASAMQFTIELSKGIRPLSQERLDEKRAIGTPDTPLINWGIMIDTLRYQVHRG